MSTNNFFRTLNTVTPYPPGDAVNRFSFLTKDSFRGGGGSPCNSGGQLSKLTSAFAACSSSNNNSCSNDFFITFPSGSLQSGSSKVYSDEDGTTLAYPNGGDGFFHIGGPYNSIKNPLSINCCFSCRIETGSIITDLVSCDRFLYNTGSLSAKKTTATLACAETTSVFEVFYQGILTASATQILNSSILYTKSADTLVRFDNSGQGGVSTGYFKVIGTSESPSNQFTGQSLYWASVGGTLSTSAFSTCGNGAVKIPSSDNNVFLAVCADAIDTFNFSSGGQYPGTGDVFYSSSLTSGAYVLPGYYHLSSSNGTYWVRVPGFNGVIGSTGTCTQAAYQNFTYNPSDESSTYDACELSTTTAIYHNGNGNLPTAGDYLYDGSDTSTSNPTELNSGQYAIRTTNGAATHVMAVVSGNYVQSVAICDFEIT
tara:strand:+ start:1393 stop:2673 length:1281 start_codon:yes stop_codon:yes gene_type:complete